MQNRTNFLSTLICVSFLVIYFCVIFPAYSWKCIQALGTAALAKDKPALVWSRVFEAVLVCLGTVCCWGVHRAQNLTWAAGAHQHHLPQGALLHSNLQCVLHLADQGGWRCSNRTLFLLNWLICWNGSMLEMFPQLSDSDESWARLHSTVPSDCLGFCGFLTAQSSMTSYTSWGNLSLKYRTALATILNCLYFLLRCKELKFSNSQWSAGYLFSTRISYTLQNSEQGETL